METMEWTRESFFGHERTTQIDTKKTNARRKEKGIQYVCDKCSAKCITMYPGLILQPTSRSKHNTHTLGAFVGRVAGVRICCVSYFHAAAVIAKTKLPPAAGPGWNETGLGGCFSWLTQLVSGDCAGGRAVQEYLSVPHQRCYGQARVQISPPTRSECAEYVTY